MTPSVNPNLPYYGMTREQVVALGHDPDVVEAGRLAAAENRQQQARGDEAQILIRAREAVELGELTWAEAAAALKHGGFAAAHAAIVQDWRTEDAEWDALNASDELASMDAAQYADLVAQQEQAERAELSGKIANINRQIADAQVKELQADLKAFIDSTPGAHALGADVEARIVRNLQESGALPSTPEERAAVIESAVKETAVLGNVTESLRQQIDAEWRLHRYATGATDGLMTAADIAAAEAQFKAARFQQLADSTLVNLDELKPTPSADEQSAALVERYRGKQAKSDGLHRDIASMVERSKAADAKHGHGAALDDREGYRDAVARAESLAEFGEVKTAAAVEAASSKPGGYGPDGTWAG